MFLPDTNILIKYIDGEEPFKKLLSKWVMEKELEISVITVAEFIAGATNSEEMKLELILNEISPLSIDLEIAKTAAQYRIDFRIKTKRVYLIDCLIAATAKAHDLTLVTLDKSDYPMKDIKILDEKGLKLLKT